MSWIPDPAPSAPLSVTVGVPYQPFCAAGEIDADEVGLFRSTLNDTDFVTSVFPATSVDMYCTVWFPSPVTVNGPAYVVGAPPSTEYWVDPTPDVASVPASVTWTPPRYQPF